MTTWADYTIAVANHNRRTARADATGWMRPIAASGPLRVRLAALLALGSRHQPTTSAAARDRATTLPARP